MYRRHTWGLVIVEVGTAIAVLVLGVDYQKLASNALTLISIVIAVYIAVASALLGSPYAANLKKIRDMEKTTQSELGVLSKYLLSAGRWSITTLVISCAYLLEPALATNLFAENVTIKKIISAIACDALEANIFFLWVILEFLIVSLSNATNLEKQDND